MYVCVCRAVTDRHIREAVKRGVDTLDGVREELGVAAQCGKCEEQARCILNAAKAERAATDVADPRDCLSALPLPA